MSPEAELVLDRLRPLPGASLFVALCPDTAAAAGILGRSPDVLFYNCDYSLQRAISSGLREPASAVFGPRVPAGGRQPGQAVVFLPRERELVRVILGLTAGVCGKGSPVWLAGKLKAGARSARRLIEECLGPISRSVSARHCLLYEGRIEREPAAGSLVESAAWHGEVEAAGITFRLVSLPGVFSHGKLDAGTRLLLETLPRARAKRVLDFGCGSGALGVALKRLLPHSQVDLVDSDAFALEAAAMTLKENGMDAGCVRATDVFSNVTERYDLIVSNPPFHFGTETDWGVADAFIQGAPAHLEPGGRLRIVSNRPGKLQAFLKRAFGSVEIFSRRGPYAILESISSQR